MKNRVGGSNQRPARVSLGWASHLTNSCEYYNCVDDWLQLVGWLLSNQLTVVQLASNAWILLSVLQEILIRTAYLYRSLARSLAALSALALPALPGRPQRTRAAATATRLASAEAGRTQGGAAATLSRAAGPRCV
eukprot:6196716-Pleurochrysis_carterae.AAC.1